jgi:hypothetical protein
MEKLIEIVQLVDNGNGTQSIIAECNGYVDGERVTQFSRSPFTFSISLTIEEMITHLWENQYSIYA